MNVKRITSKFTDKRGEITPLLDFAGKNLTCALLITSKKGAVRANHYHKKDTHYVYLISGLFEYFEKETRSKSAKCVSRIIKPGDLVKTNPGVIHAMKFLQDSVMIVFTTEPRQQEKYEADTVRVKLIDS